MAKIKEYDKSKAKFYFVLLKFAEVIAVLTFIFGFYGLGLIQNFFIRKQIWFFNLSLESPFTNALAIWFAGWLFLFSIFIIGFVTLCFFVLTYWIISMFVKVNWRWSKSLAETEKGKKERLEKENERDRKRYGHAIGDSVTIKEKLNVGTKYSSVKFVKKMQKYTGKVAKIKKIDEDGDFRLDVDDQTHFWSKEMFVKSRGK